MHVLVITPSFHCRPSCRIMLLILSMSFYEIMVHFFSLKVEYLINKDHWYAFVYSIYRNILLVGDWNWEVNCEYFMGNVRYAHFCSLKLLFHMQTVNIIVFFLLVES